MAEILVTGGAGFIGANFVRYWRNVVPAGSVIVLDALTYAGNRSSIKDIENVELVVGDIRDTEKVTRLLIDRSIDTVVHFAAESHVDRSIAGPDAFVSTNVTGTHSLLKAARVAWLDRGSGRPHRFHNVSTDEVFGSLGPEDSAFSEMTPFSPNSPYSASKAGADHLVRAYHHTFGLETTTSHCSNNFGPFQYPEKLIPLFFLNAFNGRTLPVYGDGLNRRDWLFVGDHCRAIGLILEHGAAGESYNIGGGSELANIEVTQRLCRHVDAAFAADPSLSQRFPHSPAARGEKTDTLMRFVTDRLGHDRRYAIDDRKAQSSLGYRARTDFDSGLEATLRWYLANGAWWAPLLGRSAG